jgi:hypothetical protein
MAMSHAVYVTVASDEVYLALGGRRDVMLTVQNTGSSVEHYRLDVSGIPAECYDLDPPHLTLPASASAHVSLALHLPAGATSATGRYPVTVQVTSEDDPTHGASVGFVLIVDSGSGLDMDVQPAEATGRDATFQIAFLNQGPTPAVVALTARDSEDALCVHVEPADPVVVPPGATAALAAVHVRPKRRRTGDRPQRYAIEFRGRPVGSGPLGTPALVAHARFTYLPREAAPAQRQWGRRVALVLLLFLLASVGAQRLATVLRHAPPRPSAPRIGVTRPQGSANRVPGRSIHPPVALRNPTRLSPVALVNPTMLSWGDQSVKTASAPLLIHVLNVGPTPLLMTQVLIAGINPRDFTARGTCAPRTLGSYDGCTVAVRFTPLASGTRRATLIIRANAVDSLQQVQLTGHGLAQRT